MQSSYWECGVTMPNKVILAKIIDEVKIGVDSFVGTTQLCQRSFAQASATRGKRTDSTIERITNFTSHLILQLTNSNSNKF